jgi:formate hydrogenlyase subunit 3/multisubunit Na+/H+ antiporter MnhD subunit
MPTSIAALGVAGVSIMGLPPSGGFNAKWLLLESAAVQGRWGIAAVLLIGGLLAAVYLFKLIEQAFTSGDDVGNARAVPLSRELLTLALAMLALLLGFVSMPWMKVITAGGGLLPVGIG